MKTFIFIIFSIIFFKAVNRIVYLFNNSKIIKANDYLVLIYIIVFVFICGFIIGYEWYKFNML